MNIKFVSPFALPKPSHLLTRTRVRTLTGKEIELDIEPSYPVNPPPLWSALNLTTIPLTIRAQVSRIKERVEEKEGIPPVQQRLIYGGKQMYASTLASCESMGREADWKSCRADQKTAEDYGLEGGNTLHLVLALRGGR